MLAPPLLFGHAVKPESLSLFSSSCSDPLALWAVHQDADLSEDSGIRLLIDQTNEAASEDMNLTHESFTLRFTEANHGSSSDAVLHIQSPAIRTTFIRSPPDETTELGIELPYISLQFRSIGSSRPFSFEIGVIDDAGHTAAVRVSSFQREPKLYFRSSGQAAGADEKATRGETGALLHLPLTLAAQPDQDAASLTAWQVVTLPLDRLAKHMSNTSLASPTEAGTAPGAHYFGRFHSISFVKVYANVRLRRVWCSRQLPDHDLAEFQMFS